MTAKFYPEMEDRGFVLDAQIAEIPLYVDLDRTLMNRVVTNLLGNAMKYNPAGTVLYVSCDREEDQAVVWIGDNGVGLREGTRDSLFDEFVRTAGSGQDGSGLGLIICKKMITLHHGTIELVDDPGYSTLFRITLPCGGAKSGADPS